MNSMVIRKIDLPVQLPHGGLPDLIEAIGNDNFAKVLVRYLHQLCGADHCAAFKLGNDRLNEVAASSIDPSYNSRAQVDRYVHQEWWRQDPAMREAQQCLPERPPRVFKVDFSGLGYSALRPSIYPHVADRILVCGGQKNTMFGLSILRSDLHSEFSQGTVERISAMAAFLVSLLAKHADIVDDRPNVALALTSLDEIEACIRAMATLPRREAEVCTRILYGMSTVGISLDLGVGEESVKTYRKRAYLRLNLGSERELLTWYLSLWSQWRGHFYKYVPKNNCVLE